MWRRLTVGLLSRRNIVMLLVGVIALLVGIGFGAHCKVLVLVPLHGAAFLLALASLVGGAPASGVVCGSVLASLACNVGYALGGAIGGWGRERRLRPYWQRARF